MQKQAYLSLPTALQGRASCLGWGVGVRWEQWQAASGNFALRRDSHHPSAVLKASITSGSESCLLAGPEDTAGARQGLIVNPKITSQPTTATGRGTLGPDELCPLSD